MKPIGILNEKRKHARNEAEQALRDADRKERGAKHGKQVQAMNYYGGRNAPTGHHISMGIRDEDGQLTPKAAKTYIAHRKANLQRTREKRQFNQSMGDK
mgnify:CR=1 FL=1